MEAKKFDLMVSATKNPRIDGVLSPDLLRNDTLAKNDIAALDLNSSGDRLLAHMAIEALRSVSDRGPGTGEVHLRDGTS